jgi:S-adenosylmethionine:tRNA ribosyltransferase-isomerase
MHPSALQIKDFTYELPDEKIARYPLQQRDHSRLLVYKNETFTEDTYQHIARFVPEQALLVFNQTKVIHARLLFRKPTGGRIEVFCLEPDDRYSDVQTAMLQQDEVYWKCMVGGAAKWKAGQVLELEETHSGKGMPKVYAALHERAEGVYILHLYWNDSTGSTAGISFAEVLHYAGKVPLPPYLNREAEQTDEDRYQTIFAKEEGSVAAPTAALHFTPEVMQSLEARHVQPAFVTLHVGAGTFKPVKSETMEGHDMHAEWIEVTPQLLQEVLKKLQDGHPVVAVGTTSSRTLESLYWIGVRLIRKEQVNFSGIAVPQWYPYEHPSDIAAPDAFNAITDYLEQQRYLKLVTRTQVIIAPGYDFRIISGLVTNFHQPQSTLLLLVAALVGESWRNIYTYALEHNFRFLSYGDGCLLWKQ